LRAVGGAVNVGVVGVISQKSISPWVDELNGVALFTGEVIDDTISATSEETVSTTVGIWCVGVERSIITLFNTINNSVTAVGGTSGGTSSVGSVVWSIITLFVVIGVSVTTSWVGTVDTALAGVNTKAIEREGTVIALLSTINNTVTTSWETTVLTTSVRLSVTVGSSVIALFALRIEDSVTALSSTDGAATIEVQVVSIITVLSWVTDTITTSWETAVKTASTWSAVAVSCSIIARFIGIDDSITTIWFGAVVTAARRRRSSVVVVTILITRFVNTPEARGIIETLGSSVTTRAVRELREFVNELLQERRSSRVRVGGVIRSCEEERSDECLSV
jgi:hypothetical protein